MELSSLAWLGFGTFLIGMLALDLGVFHRKSHIVGFREAMMWTLVWVALAFLFAFGLRVISGPTAALEFLTAWTIEKSLSIDNVFVFALIFSAMKVPRHCEHKVLFWGVFGALVMRVIMIFAGVSLINRFHWLIYVFGVILIIAAIRMLKSGKEELRPDDFYVVKLFRKVVPMTDTFRDDRFMVVEDGRRLATPLLMVLLFVEWSDLVFAVDSIPAIIAISRDPFIVFTSNAFAILGLRSLYFALAGLMDRFKYLQTGLAAILGFVGTKMLLIDLFHVPVVLSLTIILLIAGTSVVLSLLKTAPETAPELCE